MDWNKVREERKKKQSNEVTTSTSRSIDWDSVRAKRHAQDVALLKKNYSSTIKQLENDASEISKYQSNRNNWWNESKNREYSSKSKDNTKKIENILRILENDNQLDEITNTSLNKMKLQFQNSSKLFDEERDYFSQWENEDAFNYAKAQNDKKQTYANMTDEELEQEIEKNKQGNQWYDKAINKLSKIGSYIPTTDANTPISTVNKMQQAQQTTRGAVEQSEKESLEKDTNLSLLQQEKNNRVLKEFATLPDDVKNLIKGYVEVDRTQDESNVNKIAESLQRGFTGGNQIISQQDYIQGDAEAERLKQLQQYRQALNNSGVKNWEKYLDAVRIQSDGEYYKDTREQTKEFAEKHPVASSIGSVLMAPTKMLGTVEMLESALDKNSEQLNYNSPYFVGNRMSDEIRSTVMENYDWVADEKSANYFKNNDWFDTFYGMAMSSGDTLINTAIGGGVPGVAASMLGVEAATDTAMQTAENGGSKWDALVTGTIAGVNEALFEKISIGNLKGMASKSISNYFSKDGVKTLFLNLAKSGLINASEEACTEAANIVTDYLVNGGTSSFVETYNAGLAQGLSEAEAKKQAYTAMSKQIGEAGVSGALQGLLFGGLGISAAGATQLMNESQSGAGYTNKQFSELREEAQKLGVDVSRYSFAKNSDVGRLETIVVGKRAEKARLDLLDRAEKIGLDTKKYNTKTVEGFEQLVEAIKERNSAIYNELTDTQYFVYKKAFKDRLLSLNENSKKAEYYSTFLSKMYIKGESMPGNVMQELDSNENVRQLVDEYKANVEWVQEADSKMERANAEIEKRYQMKRDEARGAEIDEKIEAVSSSQNVAPVTSSETELKVTDENTVRNRIYNNLYNSAVVESADGMYETLFNEYYNAGLKGIGSFGGFDKSMSWAHQIAPESFRRSVYESAKSTRFNDAGVHRMYQQELDSRQQAQVDILDALGKKFGISFIVSDTFDGEGGNLNGFYLAGTNKVGVALDAEGDLYLRTAGHECYHYIETWNKKGAVELRDMVIDYLKESKDYNYKEQVEQYAKAYKLNPVENIDKIHSEMVADCMFDVFSNERFVNNLVKENKTLAQKVCDFIKELLSEIRNMIKNYHNSPEMEALKDMRALLETINKNFEYQLEIASENAAKAKNAELQSTAENSEQKNNTTDDSGVKYSLKKTKNNIPVVVVNDDIIKNATNQKELISIVKKSLVRFKKVPIKGKSIYFIRDTKNEYTNSKYTQWLKNNNEQIYKDKMRLAAHPQDIVYATTDYINEGIKHQRKDNIVDFARGNILIDISGRKYTAEVVVGFTKKGICELYDIVQMNSTNFEYKKEATTEAMDSKKESNRSVATSFTNSISISSQNVNENQEKIEKNTLENEKIVKSIKLSPDARKILDANPELKQAFEYLQSQFKLARDYIPSEEQLMNYAKTLKKQKLTTLDVYELKNDLRNIYTVLSSMTDSRGLEYATSATFKLAEKILNNSKILDEENLKKKELREQLNSALKGRKFRLTEEVKQEIIYHYGSWQEFVKQSHGISMHLAKNAKHTLESEWSDLCSELPDLLDADTNEKDQVFALIEAYNETEVDYGLHDDYAFNGQLQFIASEILETIEQIPSEETFRSSIEDRHAQELNKLREDTAKQIKTLKKKHQDDLLNKSDYWRKQIKQRVESRKATEVRNRIERQMIRLSGMMAKGTKNRHIPLQLIEPMYELCQSIVLRNSLQDKLAKNLNRIQANYEALTESDDAVFRNAFAEEVNDLIKQLNKSVAKKDITTMSVEELVAVDEIVRAVAQKVTRSNQLFLENRHATAEAAASAVCEEVKRERTKVDFKNDVLNDMSDRAEQMSWKLLKPIYAFRLIGSETLMDLEHNLRKGEDTWATDLREAKEKFETLSEKYNRNKWRDDKITVRLFQGDCDFTIEQLMMLYVAFQREQYIPHLLNGGIVFEDAYMPVNVRDSEGKRAVKYRRKSNGGTTRLHQDDFKAIAEALTQEQKNYADEMRDYLSFDLAEKGNGVTRQLYDLNRFIEKKYFPIQVAREFLDSKVQDANVKSVLALGMTKDLQEQAANPVLLRDFDTMWAEHVQQMATFHSFALPIDDFNKVYNFRTTSKAATVSSVKAELEDAWGKGATEYIENFLRDVNGGVRTDQGGTFLNKGITLFKKSAVLGSLSVAIQQPSAVARALAIVDAKYFAKTTISKRDYDEVMKYAPIAQIKSMGFFDTGIGKGTVEWLTEPKYKGKEEKIKAFFKDGEYTKKTLNDALSKFPEIMDELTWAHIWNAVKAEQKDLNKNLDGEELLKKTAERFTEVIELTQVYDSVFSKSELMRSKDTGAKMLTAFMAEPTVSLNMYVDAFVNAKNGKVKQAGRFVSAVIMSTFLNAVLKSIVSAARDDDEDETYLEKYLTAVMSNFGNDLAPWNLVPGLRDIASIFSGYSVDRADMTIFSNLFDAIQNLTSDDYTTFEKVQDFGGAVASVFGVPLKNVMRDFKAVGSFLNGIFTGGTFTADLASVEYNLEKEYRDNWLLNLILGKKKDSDRLYDAILDGDNDMYNYLVKTYSSPSAVKTAIRSGLKDNDPRVREAAEHRLKKDSVAYGMTVNEIINDGFPKNDVISAVDSVYNSLVEEPEEETTEKEKSIYTSDDLNNAIEMQSNYETIIDDMLKVEQTNGKTEEQAENTVRNRINNYWRDEFINAGDSERETIRDMLDRTGLYEDIEEKTNKWLLSELKEKYKNATSYSERKAIENQIWALDYYDSRASMKTQLKKWLQDDEEEK